MNRKLSADPSALIFGITSLVIILLGCCCGVLAFASFALSIIGIVVANRSLREYNNAPEEFDFNSKNNVFIGKILSIVALVLSSIFVIIFVVYFAIVGTVLTGGVLKESLQNKYQQKEQDSVASVYFDSIAEGNEKYIDSLKVELENK